jgi:hypothetical protein
VKRLLEILSGDRCFEWVESFWFIAAMYATALWLAFVGGPQS